MTEQELKDEIKRLQVQLKEIKAGREYSNKIISDATFAKYAAEIGLKWWKTSAGRTMYARTEFKPYDIMLEEMSKAIRRFMFMDATTQHDRLAKRVTDLTEAEYKQYDSLMDTFLDTLVIIKKRAEQKTDSEVAK